MRRLLCAVLLVAGAVFASFCLVVIDERQIGFRTLLGIPEPEPVLGMQLNQPLLLEPGLYLRIPGFHHVDVFEKRRQRFDSPRHEPQTAEGELIRLDYYVIWRVGDPRRFFEAFRGSEVAAQNQIDNTSYGELRTALGHHSLSDLLSARRAEILRAVAQASHAKLSPQGVDVLDLQIRSLDYPDQNLEQIYLRMRSERERYALRARAQGQEEALAIRSKADEEVRVIAAEAEREAQRLRGEGDAEASRIYAEAYARDAEFYAFVRSLEAYRKTIDERTTLILSRDVPFLRYLFEPRAGAPARAPTR
jgi:membrane protease subunit HflC